MISVATPIHVFPPSPSAPSPFNRRSTWNSNLPQIDTCPYDPITWNRTLISLTHKQKYTGDLWITWCSSTREETASWAAEKEEEAFDMHDLLENDRNLRREEETFIVEWIYELISCRDKTAKIMSSVTPMNNF